MCFHFLSDAANTRHIQNPANFNFKIFTKEMNISIYNYPAISVMMATVLDDYN